MSGFAYVVSLIEYDDRVLRKFLRYLIRNFRVQ